LSEIFEKLPETLECPKCGMEMTHQNQIEIFSRQEDGETQSILVDMETGKIGQGSNNNPSPRRQGVSIYLRCEDGCEFTFNIYQHKGFTCLDYD